MTTLTHLTTGVQAAINAFRNNPVIVRVPTDSLKFNSTLTGIRPVDSVLASRYAQNMLEGVQFPPILVARDDTKVIDGNIILAANRINLRKGHSEYEFSNVTYTDPITDKCELAIFAARCNLSHGNPYSGAQRRRLINFLERNGWNCAEIADILKVPEPSARRTSNQSVIVGGVREPAKRNFSHLYGTKVSKPEYKAHNDKDVAISDCKAAEQLMRHISNPDLVSHDMLTYDALAALPAAIKAFFNSPKVAANVKKFNALKAELAAK